MTEVATRSATALNPVTGELLDLATAQTIELAQTLDGIGEAHRALADFESQVSEECLRRMDSGATWTLHEGAYTLSAPSPTAGTVDYPPDALEEALSGLVAEGRIEASAAARACDRRLVLELRVPFDADHRALARKVKDAVAIEVAGVEVAVVRSEARAKASASAIAALRKIPGVGAVLDGASAVRDPGRRKVTVKRA